MRLALVLPLLAVALLLAGGTAAAKKPTPQQLAVKGLARAVKAGRITPTEATLYRRALARATRALDVLTADRAAVLETVIRDVAALAGRYDRPRALNLFTTLDENVSYLLEHGIAPNGTDVVAPDGVVYRSMGSHGLVFHPLANFARLNRVVLGGDNEATMQLAAALISRAEPGDGTLTWEYLFPYGSGSPPWTSGMAQAVGAQALSRAGDRLSDASLLDAADAAFRAIGGPLLIGRPEGPWISLYSFDHATVLNAQLQTVVSLTDYAEIVGSPQAVALADRMRVAAETLLPRFDTGYWSLYSLGGSESPIGYHRFVVFLLGRLAQQTGNPEWKQIASRFRDYEQEPPAVKLADALEPGAEPVTIYPVPADGFKDGLRWKLWVSKLSSVTFRAGREVRGFPLSHGDHTVGWAPDGNVAPGLYRPTLTLVDAAGNRSVVQLPAVRVAFDRTPPDVTAEVEAPATLTWQAVDEGTPWVELTVRLQRGKARKALALGRRALDGSADLDLPPGRWRATLVARNSAGRATTVALGMLPA